MAADGTDRILARLEHLASDVTELKSDLKQGQAAITAQLKELNGTVRENQQRITVLECTALRINTIKISAIAGGIMIAILVIVELVRGFI